MLGTSSTTPAYHCCFLQPWCSLTLHTCCSSSHRCLVSYAKQVPPRILEEDCAVPEVRRSFSEPSVVGRRGALELTRESLEKLAGRRGFAMAGA